MTIKTKREVLECHPGSTGRNKLFGKRVFMRNTHYRYQLRWFKGLFGITIIIFSLDKLVWNEKEAILVAKCYDEVLKSEVLLSSESILPENEGKLVQVTGHLDIPHPLQQHPYGISIRAVKLKRRVQMYQWAEERVSHADAFDENSYQYRKVWKDKLINSSSFIESRAHSNPPTLLLESTVFINQGVFLGSFHLTDELKDKFKDYTEFTSSERPESSEIKMHMGLYFHSADIWKPTIGDLRVQFSFTGPVDTFVSIIARQVGHELRPFRTSLESGTWNAYIHEGKKSYLEILQTEYSSKTNGIWWTRGMTWFLTFVGSFFVVNAVVVERNPRSPFRWIFLDMVALRMGLVMSTVAWQVTLGIVWLPFRPVLGVLLLLFTSLLLFYFLRSRRRRRRPHKDNKFKEDQEAG